MSTDTPAQWRMVPMEATQEMCAAAVRFANGSAVYKNVAAEALKIEESIYAEVYEAMLAASPQPTAAQPVAWCSLLPNGKIGYFEGKPMVMPGPVGNEHHTTPLYASAAPTQAAQEPASDVLGLPFAEARSRILAMDLDSARGMAVSLLIPYSLAMKYQPEPAAPVAELVEALRIFVGCALPVSTEIDKRGHRWTEAYLDQALPIGIAALERAALSRAPGAGMPNARLTCPQGREEKHE